MKALAHPEFVKFSPSPSSGGDPLGLDTASSSLYQSVFAGLNNSVRYIRVYSALCWMVQQIDEALGSDPREEAREEAFASGLPKMILLLVWANKERGLRGLPGVRRHWKKVEHWNFPLVPSRPTRRSRPRTTTPRTGVRTALISWNRPSIGQASERGWRSFRIQGIRHGLLSSLTRERSWRRLLRRA